MRSGAYAPDSPFVIFVAACGGCLQIPSGLSTPRVPQATATPGSVASIFTGAGTKGLRGVLATGGVWRKILRGPLPAGRAGGLWEHTQCLASYEGVDGLIRCGCQQGRSMKNRKGTHTSAQRHPWAQDTA